MLTAAANAIEHSMLFEDLQRSKNELAVAYDETIEGWSRALDLRDKETEGHSRRVTELSMRIARAMQVPSSQLQHIRRGALLHDIGKVGVPDAILMKPGPLDDDEWKIMRLHTVYAFNLLSPIQFLRPAMDIPYCHHEKWDGTGYPRRPKGRAHPAFGERPRGGRCLGRYPFRQTLSRGLVLARHRGSGISVSLLRFSLRPPGRWSLFRACRLDTDHGNSEVGMPSDTEEPRSPD